MIAITGATGHLGRNVIDQLLKNISASEIVAVVRNKEKATTLQALGVQIREADYLNKEALINAFQGVQKVLLISSNDLNDRFTQHKNVVDAAKNSGVEQIVYTGVHMKNAENSVLKDFMADHFQTDEYIKASGLNYTLLQHNLYADVLPMFLGEQVLETGIFFPAGNGKVPFALRREMGEAAANVLSSDDHKNKVYHISSSESVDFETIASTLSDLSGKTVNYTNADLEHFEAALKGVGLPEEIIGMSIGFATAMKHNDFDVPGNDLEKLLGRKPASIEQALEELFINN